MGANIATFLGGVWESDSSPGYVKQGSGCAQGEKDTRHVKPPEVWTGASEANFETIL